MTDPIDGAAGRVLPLAGVHNFRDAGGYRTATGGPLRAGWLWRSAHHQDATDDDLATIDTLDLATVVDLRGDDERRDHPCRRGPGFRADVRFAPGITAGLAPHLAAAQGSMDAATARARMIDTYAGMPDRPVLTQSMRLFFDSIAANQGPVLVHCVAGKDRTGFAVALLHRLMGVHDDDVLADYLLTNSAGRIDERIAQGAGVLGARFPGISDDTVRVLMSVQPDFLAAAFARVDELGGVERYAADRLGVDAGKRQQIEKAMLA